MFSPALIPCGRFSFDLCFLTSFLYWQIPSPMSSQRFPFCYPRVFNLSFLMKFSFSSVIPRVWREFPSCFFMHLLARSLTNFLLPYACIGYGVSDAFARPYINDLRVLVRVPPFVPFCLTPECPTGSRLFPSYVRYPFASAS